MEYLFINKNISYKYSQLLNNRIEDGHMMTLIIL